MDNHGSSSPAMPDGPKRAGMAWRRTLEGRFEWVAPSPSPAVVAELESLHPDIVQVPLQSLEEEEARWLNHSIIARSLSRWIPSEVIIREFQRAGIPGEIEVVTLAHRHFLVWFSDPQAMETALGRPWVANGQPLAVAQWQPDFVPAASSILHALLWIRLPQLPIEYWTDEVLSSILSVAGQFLFTDASTRERNRGGFARACVRVDLSKPLRPGARIRGNRAPFWQQFSYENLDGICGSCGALHFDGGCGAEQAASSSSSPSSEPRYGPWMATISRRKPSQDQQQSAPRKGALAAKPVPPSSASQDGWTTPRKVARRFTGRVPANQGVGALHSPPVQMEPACRFPLNVPVGTGSSDVNPFAGLGSEQNAATEKGSLMPSKEVQLGQSPLSVPVGIGSSDANPFASLSSDQNADTEKGSLMPSKEVQMGQSKRARPVEPLLQRVVSKTTKAKGKASLRGKGRAQDFFKFSASSDSLQGSGGLFGPGSKKSRSKDGPALASSFGPSLPSQEGGLTHDSAVSIIKKAIQREDSMVVMDESPTVSQGMGGCYDRGLGGPHSASDRTVLELPGDMDEVPPTQVSK